MEVVRSTAILAALLGFLPIAGTLNAAHAQARTVVILNGSDGSEAARAAVRALRRALVANPRLSPRPPGEITTAFEGPLQEPKSAGDANIDERIKAADDAIAKFDYDRALIQLFRAERPLIDQPPSKETRSALADVNFRLGLIYHGQGAAERALEAFRAVHFLTPDREVDPARYLPDVVGEFERARPGVADSTLSVSSSVEGAAVFVDGKPSAVAPAEIEVPAGVHYVLVLKTGHRPSGRRVVTKPGGVEPVRIALGPLPVTQRIHVLRWRLSRRHPQTRADAGSTGREAMRLGEASAAVVITRGKSGLVATAVTKDRVFPPYPLPAGADDLATELSPPPKIVIPSGPDKTPWYKKTWPYVTGGAVLAAATVVTAVVLTRGDDMRPSGGLCFPPDC